MNENAILNLINSLRLHNKQFIDLWGKLSAGKKEWTDEKLVVRNTIYNILLYLLCMLHSLI